jgi:hypothetical protein
MTTVSGTTPDEKSKPLAPRVDLLAEINENTFDAGATVPASAADAPHTARHRTFSDEDISRLSATKPA